MAKDPVRAEAVLVGMDATYGVRPDATVIGMVITAWGQAKNPERAEAVLAGMADAAKAATTAAIVVAREAAEAMAKADMGNKS